MKELVGMWGSINIYFEAKGGEDDFLWLECQGTKWLFLPRHITEAFSKLHCEDAKVLVPFSIAGVKVEHYLGNSVKMSYNGEDTVTMALNTLRTICLLGMNLNGKVEI